MTEISYLRPQSSQNSELQVAQKLLRSALDRVTALESEASRFQYYKKLMNDRLASGEAAQTQALQQRDKSREAEQRAQRVAAALMSRVNKTEAALADEKQRVSEAFEAMKSEWSRLVEHDTQIRGIIAQLQDKNRQLKEQSILQQARVQALETEREGWRNRGAEVDEEILRLKGELEDALRERDSSAGLARELESQLENARAELSATRQEAETLSAELDQAHRAVLQQQQEKQRMESRLADSEQVMSQSREQAAQLARELARLRNVSETFETERRNWLDKDVALQQQIEELAGALLESGEKSQTEVGQVREKLEGAMVQLRSELAQARSDLAKSEELKTSLWRELVAAERSREQAKNYIEAQNKKLQLAAEDFQSLEQASRNELEKTRNELATEKGDHDRFRAEAAALQDESTRTITRLEQELRQTQELLGDMTRRHGILEEKLAHLSESHAQAKSTLEALTEEREELRKQNGAKAEEIARLELTLEHEREGRTRTTEAHHADRVSLESLTVRLGQAEDLKNHLNEKLLTAENARDEARREIARLQVDLSQARTHTQEAERSRDATQAELTKARGSVEEAQRTIFKLQEELKKSEQLYLRMGEERRDLVRRADEAYQEATSLRIEVVQTREQVQRELSEKVSELQEKLAVTEQKKQELERQEAQRREDLLRLRNELSQSGRALTEGHQAESALRTECAKLQQSLESLRGMLELSRQESAKWENLFQKTAGERDEWSRKAEQASGEAEVLREKLLHTNDKLNTSEAINADLLAREERSQEQLSGLRGEIDTLKERTNGENQLKSVVAAEVRRLRDDLVKIGSELQQAENAKKALWDELVQMEKAKGELVRQSEQLKGELAASQVSIENLSEERRNLLARGEDFSERISELEDELAVAQENTRRLDRQLADQTRLEAERRKEIDRLQQALKESNSAAQMSRAEWRDLESLLRGELKALTESKSISDSEVARLREALSSAEKRTRMLSEDQEKIGKSLVELQVERQSLTQALENSERMFRELETEHESSAKSALEKQLEIDRIRRDLDRAMRNFERSERERLELAAKEGIARLELEKFRKLQLAGHSNAAEPSEPLEPRSLDLLARLGSNQHGSA